MTKLRTPVAKVIRDPDACSSPERCSTARELFAEHHEPAELTVHAYDENAIPRFQGLGKDVMPILPFGHQWVQSEEGQCSIIKKADADSHELDVVVYGPDRGKINYLFMIDGVTHQSFAHTKQGKGPKRTSFPIGIKDYEVQGYHYEDAKSHIRGHCIDHADTMLTGGQQFQSTLDRRNFIPESSFKYWGLHMRRLLVTQLRKEKKGYLQFVHYPENCLVTRNGTPVPDYLYFYSVNINSSKPYSERYSIDGAYNIDWNVNYQPLRPGEKKVVEFCQDYTTSGAPVVSLWDVNQSDRGARLQIRNMYKRSEAILSSTLSALHPSRDAMFAKAACAEMEFESSKYKFYAAMQASKEKEAKLARNELNTGLIFCNSLIQADEKRTGIIESAQLPAMKNLLDEGAPGFEDSNDCITDHLCHLFKEFGYE